MIHDYEMTFRERICIIEGIKEIGYRKLEVGEGSKNKVSIGSLIDKEPSGLSIEVFRIKGFAITEASGFPTRWA